MKVIRALGILGMLWTMVWLGGCTAPGTIKTWEGPDRSASETGIFVAPPDIKVVAIDGVKQGEYLLDALTLRYQLLPGKRVVVFRYSGLFANPAATSDAESKALVIESPDQVAVLDVRPGVTYQVEFRHPDTLNEARALVANFSAEVVDSNGGRYAVQPWEGSVYARRAKAMEEGKTGAGFADSPLVAGNCVPAADAGAEAEVSGSGLTEGVSRLDALKEVWKQASPAEKKAFLRWAFK